MSAEALPRELQSKCPDCGAPHRFYRYEYATLVARRKCRRCGARWQIKVTPVKTKESLAVHKLDWLRL